MPNCHEWDEEKQLPRALFTQMAEAGVLQGVCGPPWPTATAGRAPAGDIKPEEFDVWCELISIDEIARCGSGGVVWGLFGGLSIGLPPVAHFGSKALKERIVGPCLRGEKVICLAITEPYAGSDVANLQCEAKLSEDGKHYIVNGEKKCQRSTQPENRTVVPRTPAHSNPLTLSDWFLHAWRSLRDHERSVRRLLHCGRAHGRQGHEGPVVAAHRALCWRDDASDGVSGRVVERHDVHHVRGCQGARQQPHRQGERGVQIHRQAAGHTHPLRALQCAG